MRRTPAMTERLIEIARAAAAAGHGGKEPIYAAACEELGISRATLHRALLEVAVRAERKQRRDAGDVTLPRAEATLISAYLMESHRKNNTKRLASIEQAVDVLRANGAVRAERTHPLTGEIVPLSTSAISRGLRAYGLHPDQLLQPAPAAQLRSLHPNHVWQIDASLCVLFYLATNKPSEQGLQVMEAAKFYKNKPQNLKRIEHDRVWRYVVTDHTSDHVFPHYVFGAESGTNLAESFIEAIQQREGEPVHGVPFVLMMDMGSANTSGLFKNLARRLGVKLLPHAPENARATGQVEQAQNLVERGFESGLKFRAVHSLGELNALARQWAKWFNGTKVHTRHGMTRYAAWLQITPEQLRIAPSREICRQLLTHAPEERKVNTFLQVEFQGRTYDVRGVPGVMVGEKLQVAINPYEPGCATIIDADADGNETLHSVPEVERDSFGFPATANVIGEEYRRPANTVADDNRSEVERVAMQAPTLEAARQARKRKDLPFGGAIDPYKPITDTKAPAYIPRKGTELPITTRVTRPVVETPVLTHFEAARELRRRGVDMNPEKNAQVAAWYPAGVPEDEIEALQARLERAARPALRVVGGTGGAAND
jgi:hypothetical protein